MSMETIEYFVRQYLQRNSDALALLGDKIFYFGELGMQEHETADLMTRVLAKSGFNVERGISGFPTAFCASVGSGKPVIALINVRGIGAKRIEFAISNAFSAYAGFHGTHGFDGRRIPVRLVVQGHTNERAILVRKNAGIKTPADLANRTFVGERRALPELALITEEFLKVHDLRDKRVNVVGTTTTDEVFRAFAAGSIDAVLLPTGPRAGNVEKALNDGHVEFLSWDPAKRDEILKNLPELMFAGTYTPSDFEGLDKEVPVIAMPFHDGVIRYFRERNVWTDELDARQKAMLAK